MTDTTPASHDPKHNMDALGDKLISALALDRVHKQKVEAAIEQYVKPFRDKRLSDRKSNLETMGMSAGRFNKLAAVYNEYKDTAAIEGEDAEDKLAQFQEGIKAVQAELFD